MRVSFPVRKMCRLVGDTASQNIERLSYASRLQSRKLIITAYTIENLSGYILASSKDLLDLFSADCGALSIRDETKLLGKSGCHLQEILAMLEYLRLRKIGSVFTSADITTDFPDLPYPPGPSILPGCSLCPSLAVGMILLFSFGNLLLVRFTGREIHMKNSSGREMKDIWSQVKSFDA